MLYLNLYQIMVFIDLDVMNTFKNQSKGKTKLTVFLINYFICILEDKENGIHFV